MVRRVAELVGQRKPLCDDQPESYGFHKFQTSLAVNSKALNV